jgi:serine/threonine protein kinase
MTLASVCEFIKGGDLSTFKNELDSLSQREKECKVREMMKGYLHALDLLHGHRDGKIEKPIIHRDGKIENILVRFDGSDFCLVLIDFSWGKVLERIDNLIGRTTTHIHRVYNPNVGGARPSLLPASEVDGVKFDILLTGNLLEALFVEPGKDCRILSRQLRKLLGGFV